MIPLWDHNETRRRPVVTYALFATNLAVFVVQLMLPSWQAQEMVLRFALIPEVLTQGDLAAPRSEGGALGALITPVTSMFLHGSMLHIASNLLFLHVFADNVEDALGRARFVAFYLVCGLGAALAQVAVDPTSGTPMIGASGAISGVLAGYMVLYPTARVVTLTPIFLVLELPAYIFIFVWFGVQLLSGLTTLGQISGGGGGVAWFAHIGGFLVGLVLMLTWARKRPRQARPPRHPPRRPSRFGA